MLQDMKQLLNSLMNIGRALHQFVLFEHQNGLANVGSLSREFTAAVLLPLVALQLSYRLANANHKTSDQLFPLVLSYVTYLLQGPLCTPGQRVCLHIDVIMTFLVTGAHLATVEGEGQVLRVRFRACRGAHDNRRVLVMHFKCRYWITGSGLSRSLNARSVVVRDIWLILLLGTTLRHPQVQGSLWHHGGKVSVLEHSLFRKGLSARWTLVLRATFRCLLLFFLKMVGALL